MSGGSAYEATPKWATLYIHDAMVSWYNNSSTNYGIAIKYESGTNGSVILKSYESGSVYRPYFMIHYTEPRLADGVYKIKNKNSNTYLDVTDGATSAGASIQQWSGGATDSNRNQLFKITYLTTYNSYNFYSIRPMTNCGLALYAPTTNITYASIEEAPLTDSYYALDSEFHWQIMENSESGTYFIKNGLSSSTNYLTNGGNNANGTRIYTSASKNHSSMWIFEPYTTAIDGVSFETFSEHLVVGETFTYKAVMFSSTIGRNGPPTYVVYNTDGSSTDKATINATTGELTALKTGTIKVVATSPGVAVGWPILVNIKKGMAGTYFIGNAKYGNFMQIENTSASIDGASLRLTNLENVNTAIWNIEYVGDDYYKIISYVSGKAVTAPSHSGGYITQTDYIGDYTQQWRFAILDGMYIMVPRSNVNYYIAAGEHINNITDVIFSGSNSDKRHQWYLYDVGSEIMLMGIKDARAPHDHVSCFSDVVTNFGMTYDYNIIHTDYISSSACLTQMQNAEIFISRSHGGYDIGYSYLQLYDNETDGLSESRLYSYQIYDSSTSTALVDFSNADVMIFVGCTTAYEGENANNLITAAINAGANCAIGFERNISCETANIWTSLFCQYYNNGYSAYDAAHRAINEIQKDFSAEGINNGLDVGSCKVMYKQ